MNENEELKTKDNLENKIKVKLIVRSGNYCQDIELPTNEGKLREDLNKLLEVDGEYEVIKIESNYDIFEDEYADLIALNKKINKLNELASIDEVVAVTEYYGYKTLDKVIECIEKKDYKFVPTCDLKKYLCEHEAFIDRAQLFDEFFHRVDLVEVFVKFDIREKLNYFSVDELADLMYKHIDGLFFTSTGLIESEGCTFDICYE